MFSPRSALFALPLFLSACATSYVAPERPARLAELGAAPAPDHGSAGPSIAAILERAPAAKWPATVAWMRVQEPRRGPMSWQPPDGKWRVASVRETERPEQLERLRGLPNVRDVALASSLLVPEYVDGDEALRAAAARMQADVLVLYTFDSTIRTRDHAPLLTLITLGLAPVVEFRTIATAQCVVLDVRTGFFYGAAEATEDRTERRSSWVNEVGVGTDLSDVERAAFATLLNEFPRTWSAIVERHAVGG